MPWGSPSPTRISGSSRPKLPRSARPSWRMPAHDRLPGRGAGCEDPRRGPLLLRAGRPHEPPGRGGGGADRQRPGRLQPRDAAPRGSSARSRERAARDDHLRSRERYAARQKAQEIAERAHQAPAPREEPEPPAGAGGGTDRLTISASTSRAASCAITASAPRPRRAGAPVPPGTREALGRVQGLPGDDRGGDSLAAGSVDVALRREGLSRRLRDLGHLHRGAGGRERPEVP